MIDAFLAAVRAGDFDALVAVLDPDLVVHLDQPGTPGGPTEIHGAQNWAKQAILFARGAMFVQTALVNGTVGAILAPRGRLSRALTFTVEDGKIAHIEIFAKPGNLAAIELGILEDYTRH